MSSCPVSSARGSSLTVHAEAEAPVVQQHFPLLGGTVVRAALLPPNEIAGLDSEAAALDLSILRSRNRQTYGWYADRLGIDRSHFARMRNGKAVFSVDAAALASITGNFALLQYQARRCGFDLAPHVMTDAEKAAAFDAMTQVGNR